MKGCVTVKMNQRLVKQENVDDLCCSRRAHVWQVLAGVLGTAVIVGCHTPPSVQEPADQMPPVEEPADQMPPVEEPVDHMPPVEEPSEQQIPDFVIQDFEEGVLPTIFSDRDEIEGSTTEVRRRRSEEVHSKHLEFVYSIGRKGDSANRAYGGFAIFHETLNALDYGVVSFRTRLVEGEFPETHLQWSDADGTRRKISIDPFLDDVSSDWTRVRVPMSVFSRYESTAVSEAVELAFIFRNGKGVLQFDDIVLEVLAPDMDGFSVEKVPYPKRTDVHLPNGVGAWCYGDPEITISAVTEYNVTAPAERKIRYLFPWAGSVSFTDNGKALLVHELENALAIAQAVGPEVHVLPMIDGLSEGASRVSTEQWNSLGQQLADLVEQEPSFGGLQIDIEPHVDELYQLFASIKAHTGKPLSAAVGTWSVDTFRYLDLTVAMAYDWASAPDEFEAVLRKRLPRFLSAAHKGGGKAMIGIPAIATHREYEAVSLSAEGPRKSTGHRMLDFVDASLVVIRSIPVNDRASLIGPCIWAIHPPGGLHGPRDTKWIFPTIVSDEIWQRIRETPLF